MDHPIDRQPQRLSTSISSVTFPCIVNHFQLSASLTPMRTCNQAKTYTSTLSSCYSLR
eukprot:c26723_g1_i1 orf=463-636(+)